MNSITGFLEDEARNLDREIFCYRDRARQEINMLIYQGNHAEARGLLSKMEMQVKKMVAQLQALNAVIAYFTDKGGFYLI